MNQRDGDDCNEMVLPLSAEELVVSKRATTERVVVRRETRRRDVTIDELLTNESIVVERVPIGQYVDAIPAIREEGDCTILPVVEEVAVVVRRLLLREEVRLRRVTTSSHYVETVTLREQHAIVSRTPAVSASQPNADLDRALGEPAPVQPNPTRSMPMSEENIVAVFDTAAHADAAVADLKAARVPDTAISRHAADSAGTMAAPGSTTTGTAAGPVREPGFWSSLFGGSSADEPVYDQSMASGGSVVVVKTPIEDADAVVAILERHKPIDLDERAESYGVGASSTAAMTTSTSTTTSTMATPTTTGSTTSSLSDTGRAVGESGTLRLAEESLAVGKRLVNQGGTRIRRYVVERPVEAEVSLRSETIQLERRPVSETGATADFTDKVVEMTATGEEAVVGKTSRVVEEVALRKEASERTETVHDTVRKQEVEIEQVPAAETVVPSPDGRTTSR